MEATISAGGFPSVHSLMLQGDDAITAEGGRFLASAFRSGAFSALERLHLSDCTSLGDGLVPLADSWESDNQKLKKVDFEDCGLRPAGVHALGQAILRGGLLAPGGPPPFPQPGHRRQGGVHPPPSATGWAGASAPLVVPRVYRHHGEGRGGDAASHLPPPTKRSLPSAE